MSEPRNADDLDDVAGRPMSENVRSAIREIPDPWDCEHSETFIYSLDTWECGDPTCECDAHREELCANCWAIQAIR
jgi:hypothetical protein